MKHNCFEDKKTIQKNLLQSLEKLENKLDKIILAINSEGMYLQGNSYQLIVNLLNPTTPTERFLFQELLQTCFQLEFKSQYSSSYFLRAFIAFGREYAKQDNVRHMDLVEDNQREGGNYLKTILSTIYPASPVMISNLIDKTAGDPIIATTVKEAVRLAGIEGNIVVEEIEQTNVSVELQFGYNFKVNPYRGFMPQFGTWLRSDVKVLLVDGMIEKVSELDKILSKSYETKIPMVVIAQGFSEEVIATLHSNNSRGTFDILPVRLEGSLDSLNMLGDIAVVCGTDVVSTLKGDMLCFIDYDSLPLVEKISLTSDVLTVNNTKSRGGVISHLNYLNTRRKDQAENSTVTDVADLTTKRIQNLLAHVVKVGIPKGSVKAFKAPIDGSIRACRTAYTYGFCKPLEVNLEGLTKTWQHAHKQMIKGVSNKETVSGIGLYLAGTYGSSLAATYFTAAGGIICEQDIQLPITD